MDLLKYAAGAIIFRAGDPADRAFLIGSGTVELQRETAGTIARLARLEAGEVFGEMSLIEERPHSLTAQAVTAVEVSSLSRDEFEHLLTTDPTTFRVYLKSLFERLRSLSAQVVTSQPAAAPAVADVSVTIHPLTRKAAATLPQDGLPVGKFPFRIGRAAGEHEDMPLDLNDLWLIDHSPFNISRNHALLERENGAIVIKDRGSSLGIYVNDVHVGGKSADRQMTLEDGDNVVILGSRMSPYQFRVEVSRSR